VQAMGFPIVHGVGANYQPFSGTLCSIPFTRKAKMRVSHSEEKMTKEIKFLAAQNKQGKFFALHEWDSA